jgi:hypothetical protein
MWLESDMTDPVPRRSSPSTRSNRVRGTQRYQLVTAEAWWFDGRVREGGGSEKVPPDLL